jgi:hypothetical protein
MKKLLALSIVLCVIGFSAFAEDGLTFGGEVKTGLNITKDGDADVTGQVKNSDDAGTPGRVRMNFNWVKGNIQFKSRFEVTSSENWSGNGANDQGFKVEPARFLKYAYAMGDFWDNQFRMSLGKIGGDKPWETSGDEIWDSIEEITGARFEFKPNAVQGLNVGFVMPAVVTNEGGAGKIEDYLQELGFGARYENDALDIRLAFRLDGKMDQADEDQDGSQFMYRLDIKALGNMVSGLSLWANGRFKGLGTVSGVPDSKLNIVNWLYVKYAQDPFSAQLRLGLENWGEGNNTLAALYIKPVVTYKLTSWAEAQLVAVIDLGLAHKDGLKYAVDKDPSFLRRVQIEPKVTFTLGSGATIAPVYTLDIYPDYSSANNGGESKLKHQFEVRLVYSF